jgi:hypothetical protein
MKQKEKLTKVMTWKEVLHSNYKTVIVQSYGYTERSSFSSHFEPFAHLREFEFEIYRAASNLGFLNHKWLKLEEPERNLNFEEKDGKLYVFDPDLWARP